MKRSELINSEISWVIISPCHFSIIGIEEIFRDLGLKPKIIFISDPSQLKKISKDISSSGSVNFFIYIPDEPFYFLLSLWFFVSGKSNYSKLTKFFFVSGVPSYWLKQNILRILGGSYFNFITFVASSKLSVKKISTYIKQWNLGVPIIQQEEKNIEKLYCREQGLTLRELEVLLDSFNLMEYLPIQRNSQVASKTLYNQRKSGILKMIKNSSELAKRLPGASKRWNTGLLAAGLTSYEEEFIASFDTQDIYPVFQPIVDVSGQIRGFEVSICWRHKGKHIPAKTFTLQLKSQNILLLLTAFSLKYAIDGINQGGGKFFFSVNIHPELSETAGLKKMCAEACRQLKDTNFSKNLVLEYSEKTNFYKSPSLLENLNVIHKMDITLFLGDCFAERHVFFPVREDAFSGYKLDESIIHNLLTNEEYTALITSLAVYCSMTGRFCIAKGIEDNLAFEKMKELGIQFFQGGLLYEPVDIAGLKPLLDEN